MASRQNRTERQLDGRKIRLSLLLGLVLGAFLTLSLSSPRKSASGQEIDHATSILSSVAGFLPLQPLAHLKSALGTVAGASPQPLDGVAEPADFIDAGIELVLEGVAARGEPTVALPTGEELRFTIIPKLQSRVEELLKSYAPVEAAFVAIDPRTGEVLALTGFKEGAIAPHRALQADGPAASIFKLISGAALVESRRVRPEREFCFHGGRSGIGKGCLAEDPQRDTECLTFAEALGQSANVVFARLAHQKLNRSEMKKYGERFAFNRVIPFVWPIELSKMDVPNDPLEFARMAAGFHHSSLSPIHGALLAASIANSGVMMKPQILKSVTVDQQPIYQLEPEQFVRTISADTASKLGRMMVTTTTTGTASKYFVKRVPELNGVEIAAKTGSLSQKRGKEQFHHSWLVGFAPADEPTIAFAALVVNGPKWRVKASHVGKAALESYFKLTAPSSSRTAAR